jgi:glutaminyl-peptide cyclotransferase
MLCVSAFIIFTSCSKTNPERIAENAPKVDGALAYELAAANLAIGPRPSGSEGALASALWIKSEVEKLRYPVEVREFRARTPDGLVTFRNVLAEIPGAGERFVLVGCHYDTKRLVSTPNFKGANDGASGVGLALAMMRAIKKHETKPPLSLKFAFFDGEECFVTYSKTDGLYGSRRLAEEWKKNGALKKCAAVVILDMVGDKDLTITIPSGADGVLSGKLLRIAAKQNVSSYFSKHESDILDDHTPFQNEGIPTIDIIDFEFGPSNLYWHTEADSLDKISSESLKIVGDAALALIWSVR